jgi:hypothetical protein
MFDICTVYYYLFEYEHFHSAKTVEQTKPFCFRWNGLHIKPLVSLVTYMYNDVAL